MDRQRQKIQRSTENLRKIQADFLHQQSAVLESEEAIDELNRRWDTEVRVSNELQDSLCFSLTPRLKELMTTSRRKIGWEDEDNQLYLETVKEAEVIAKEARHLREEKENASLTTSANATEDQYDKELQEKENELEAMKHKVLETLLDLTESG